MARKPTFVDGQYRMFEPVSDWRPHVGPLPMLEGIDVAIDTETRDGGLQRERGPGWVYDDGKIVGVSIAWERRSIYIPVDHPETPECRPLGEVMAWVDHLMRHCRVHFFNGPYDLAWLMHDGATVWPEHMEDAQVKTVMLDENYENYSLDECCRRAGIQGKDETLLREISACYGIAPKDVKKNLWKLPAKFVGPYAEQDAASTLQLSLMTDAGIQDERQQGAYRTEIELMPVVYHMRRRGIRVSETAVREAQVQVRAMLAESLARIESPPAWRRDVVIDDLRSPAQLAAIFDAEGVQYPRTAKTNQPSFTKQWLEQVSSPLGRLVRRCRQLADLDEKFLETYILEHAHRGRIHAEVHQLRDEEGGARTQRFSYSNPPLQQMPSRDQDLAPYVRKAFLPEQGAHWLAADYSGQEPRLNVHYAFKCRKDALKYGIRMGEIDALVDEYNRNPRLDLHQRTADIIGVTRREVKDWTQALTYRARPTRLAALINQPLEAAERYYEQFHTAVPYIGGLAQYAERRASMMGYVTMIDGARRHFSTWQPKHKKMVGFTHSEESAREKWPGERIERAKVYQAANSLIQGSAARQMKRAMVAMYRAGITPCITLHDEVGASISNPQECATIEEIMIETTRLVVPVCVDAEVGDCWGNAKTDYKKFFQ